MKNAFLSAAAAIVFICLLAVLARGNRRTRMNRPEAEPAGSVCSTAQATAEPEPTAPSAAHAAQTAAYDPRFSIPVWKDGALVQMDLQDYLTGVLLAELPAAFSDETRKAQAIACRTYALHSYLHRRHAPAAVCTDSTCCQGWTDPVTVPEAVREKAAQAVRETDGLVLRYQGELIEATFFSCSGGRTEAAVQVWGGNLPYLQSVESPGEEDASHFRDETRIPLADFQTALQAKNPDAVFPEAKGAWVGEITHTEGGGVGEIELGWQKYAGTEIRKLFSLRSTAFTLSLTDSEAIFETRGCGHRVGMSQYGAEAMAKAGKRFDEILKWYYRGVSVEPAEA